MRTPANTAFRWVAILLLLVGGWWLAGAITGRLPTPQLPGQRAAVTLADVTLERLDGSSVALRDFAGAPLVLNLWATWCGPCRRELPMMAAMAAERPDVTFVFADQREGADKVEGYLAENGLELEWVLLDKNGFLADHYRSPGLPTTFFFDARGELVEAHVGELTAATLFNELTALTQSNP